MAGFGYEYPAGAENDPNAPYNSREVTWECYDRDHSECSGVDCECKCHLSGDD